jgi:endonuclease/exonuclease/phosphatase (EEP) superfamily protein YafD
LNRFSEFEFGELTRVAWEGCFGGLDESDGGAADCLSQKGFSVATHVLGEGVEIDVYNLHAEAGSTPQDRTLSAADFVQLAAFIEAHSEGKAIVLGGDTNLHTDRPEHDATWTTFREATGLVDVCATLDCGADDNEIDKFAYRNSEGLSLSPLEHRFEREKFVRPDGGPLSDHDALTVRFEWTKAASR